MTVVLRAEQDMFRLAPLVDVMINPVNLVGAMGKGIALEFKNRHPDAYERYRTICKEGKFQIGDIHVVKDSSVNYLIVNLPTKRHFADGSDPDDIKRGLDKLRRWLQMPQHSLYTVCMPMLGCGEGRLGYEIMEPAFFEYLDHLDNVVHLCQWPDKMDHIPKYLAIIGPRAYANKNADNTTPELYQMQYAAVEEGVAQALASWDLAYEDFDGIVSGGALGVDTVACGRSRTDPTYKTSLAGRYSKKPPIICPADWDRLGRVAGFKRNATLIDIATHIVAFRPPGLDAIGTTSSIKLAQKAIEQQIRQGKTPKKIAVVGNQDLDDGTRPSIRM